MTVIGDQTDTMNVDDSGVTTPQTGTLTQDSLTGFQMGLAGVTYSGLLTLDVYLGSGGTTGNTFNIAVATGGHLPANTTIVAGSGGHDMLKATWAGDFNGRLAFSRFATSTFMIGGNLNGTLSTSNPGAISSITIGGSITASGTLNVENAGDVSVPAKGTGLLGNIGTMTVGASIAGKVQVSGNITTLDIGPANMATSGDQNDLTGEVIVGGGIGAASVSGSVSGLLATYFTIGSLYIGGSLDQTGTVSIRIPVPRAYDGTENLHTFTIGRDLAGTISVPGAVTTGSIEGSLSYTGVLSAGSINSLSVGANLAGQLDVIGTLGTTTVQGATPGTINAGEIGTISVDAGYGPLIAQIEEFGVERLIEATVPGAPFPIAPATPQPPAPASPGLVTFRYFYEGLVSNLFEGTPPSVALGAPQATIRVDNQSGNTAPDQFDVSLVTYSDTGKFNLARLDSTGNSGISGIRNVSVEGNLLNQVTAAAVAFFGGDTSPGGVYLPGDKLASVSVRDTADAHTVAAKSIQAVAFGMLTTPVVGKGMLPPPQVGIRATGSAAAELLAPGTAIVQAGSVNGSTEETFRVAFSDIGGVGFFMDDTPGSGAFDSKNVAFTVEGVSTANSSGTANTATPSNATRGAVVALVTVAETFAANGRLDDSIIESISLHGDGGSFQTQQTIGSSSDGSRAKVTITPAITSTGPLGDVSLAGPLPDVTAPSIFGSILPSGAIPAGTIIETTGLRTDPITGAVSQVPANLGRVYVQSSAPVPIEATTVIAANGAGLGGEIICGGNLISQVTIASGGSLSGQIVTIGNLNGGVTVNGPMPGVIATNGSMNGGVVIGGPLSGGKILCVGNINGNILINGSLESGRIATRGSILGNLTISGSIDRLSAIVSGGSIGKALAGTGLSIGAVSGILASVGPMHVIKIGSTSGALLCEQNDATDAAAIDDIFSEGVVPLSPTDIFDEATPEDLLNLARLLANLTGLSVAKGKLT